MESGKRGVGSVAADSLTPMQGLIPGQVASGAHLPGRLGGDPLKEVCETSACRCEPVSFSG